MLLPKPRSPPPTPPFVCICGFQVLGVLQNVSSDFLFYSIFIYAWWFASNLIAAHPIGGNSLSSEYVLGNRGKNCTQGGITHLLFPPIQVSFVCIAHARAPTHTHSHRALQLTLRPADHWQGSRHRWILPTRDLAILWLCWRESPHPHPSPSTHNGYLSAQPNGNTWNVKRGLFLFKTGACVCFFFFNC